MKSIMTMLVIAGLALGIGSTTFAGSCGGYSDKKADKAACGDKASCGYEKGSKDCKEACSKSEGEKKEGKDC